MRGRAKMYSYVHLAEITRIYVVWRDSRIYLGQIAAIYLVGTPEICMSGGIQEYTFVRFPESAGLYTRNILCKSHVSGTKFEDQEYAWWEKPVIFFLEQ
jgi:hypothetical protein